ncbi:hypothetical protein FIBSPDRAFT_1054136 [Athelia psychrophila]|uniref:Uncharacterized protein n=1 Tax=Athelia psychrophila TaxID=1759441 RepID=A0A167VST0_9AGAM|nr:hypothetical protein FIBSPDRAFT_1054136 [Fibularhizoctonia sp. CBS 109695]
MSAVSLLQRLAGIESLSHIPLTTFLTLIHRASALKRDISLPQTLGTSIDCAPPVLLQSVALFLAESLEHSPASRNIFELLLAASVKMARVLRYQGIGTFEYLIGSYGPIEYTVKRKP